MTEQREQAPTTPGSPAGCAHGDHGKERGTGVIDEAAIVATRLAEGRVSTEELQRPYQCYRCGVVRRICDDPPLCLTIQRMSLSLVMVPPQDIYICGPCTGMYLEWLWKRRRMWQRKKPTDSDTSTLSRLFHVLWPYSR